MLGSFLNPKQYPLFRPASGSHSTGKHVIAILQQYVVGAFAVLSGMTTAQLNHSGVVFNLIGDSVRKRAVIVCYQHRVQTYLQEVCFPQLLFTVDCCPIRASG